MPQNLPSPLHRLPLLGVLSSARVPGATRATPALLAAPPSSPKPRIGALSQIIVVKPK